MPSGMLALSTDNELLTFRKDVVPSAAVVSNPKE
jgi:hypothetical protein